jgi:RNA polymerase sigma-70 factor, ECF subfamily
MEIAGTLDKARSEGWSDLEIVAQVKAGDTALYEILMRRYNQRLYRVARAILRDDAEAEDVMQDAYVRAYQHLDQFAGRAPFAAWLTRIAVHEALRRVELRKRSQEFKEPEETGEFPMYIAEKPPDPEQWAARAELSQLLEEALLGLPEKYRAVLMLHNVEGLSVSEIAAALDLSEENVKVRLHRGRAIARDWLFERVGTNARNAFPFMGVRCDRVVATVFARLAVLRNEPSSHLGPAQ